MGEVTGISWCDHTWNPWIGCTKVSPACDGCYAAALMGDQGRYKRVVWGEPGKGAGTRVETAPATFNAPLKWNRAARAAGVKRFVFVASLADIFDNEVPIEWLAKVFAMMRRTPNLIYLALTKRPQLIERRFEAACPGEDWPENVFAGTTTEDQKRLDLNAPAILRAMAALGIPKVFLSMEPLLGAVDIGRHLERYSCNECGFEGGAEDADRERDCCSYCGEDAPAGGPDLCAHCGNANLMGHACPRCQARYSLDEDLPRIGWVITGGETDQGGHKARPTHPDWLRAIRDACAAAGVPYHHKQNGEYAPASACGPVIKAREFVEFLPVGQERAIVYRVGKTASGRLLDGVLHDAMPAVSA